MGKAVDKVLDSDDLRKVLPEGAVDSLKQIRKQINDYLTVPKKTKAKISGKEGAKDVPSWAKGNRPYRCENGEQFARRVLNEKYGLGNWAKGTNSEFSKIKKWGDRSFE